MNLETAKNLLRTVIALCLVSCIIGILTTGTTISGYVTIFSFAMLALFIYIYYFCCKCPYCGKRIGTGILRATHCPHCRRDLTSGKRKKGKGGKRVKH